MTFITQIPQRSLAARAILFQPVRHSNHYQRVSFRSFMDDALYLNYGAKEEDELDYYWHKINLFDDVGTGNGDGLRLALPTSMQLVVPCHVVFVCAYLFSQLIKLN